MSRKSYKFFIVLFGLVFAQSIYANTPGEIVETHVKWLKSLNSGMDAETLSNVKKQSRDYWRPIYKNKALYTPVIAGFLKKELQFKKFSPLVLLDLGAFLSPNDNHDDFKLVHSVLLKLDLSMPVVENFISLYYNMVLVYAAASSEISLPILDDIFLPNKANFFNADKAQNSYRIHTFGVFGESAIPYLVEQLQASKNKQRQQTILRVLRRICIKQCAQVVYDYVKNGADHVTLSHVGFALLDIGGPTGRDLFLKLDPEKFSEKSATWLKSEFVYAKKLSYEKYLSKFEAEHVPSSAAFTQEEFLQLMVDMVKDPKLFIMSHPHDFTNSKLNTKILINHLLKIRQRLFFNVNIHAGEYVSQVNEIINALYYRDVQG